MSSKGGSWADRWMLRSVLAAAGYPLVRLELRNEAEAGCPPECSVGTIAMSSRAALCRMLLDGESGFAEGFALGDVTVRGDLLKLLEEIYVSLRDRRQSCFGRAMSAALAWLQANSPTGSRRNIHRHYDLGTDFFRLWLDRELVYTCAYFAEPGMTLEEAQTEKMEYVCRKIHLRRGDSVVDLGCGWGALARYMARHYGARVKAFNISHDQIVYARQRVREEGLGELVEFVEDDYRNVTGHFDALVSVGMLEHVGHEHFGDLGRAIHRSVGDRGRGLVHFIGRNRPAPLSPWTRARIFPGAYVPALSEALKIFEPWDYAVTDVENLRVHYQWTLHQWRRRFEAAEREMTDSFDPVFLRAWKLYLAGSAVAFRTGSLQLFQVVFAGRDCEAMPPTRARLYGQHTEPARQAVRRYG